MKLKETRSFEKIKDEVEYIEVLLKRYNKILNTDYDDYWFEKSRAKAELKRIGIILRKHLLDLEKSI